MDCRPSQTDYAAWRDRLAQANDPAFWPIEAIDEGLASGVLQYWCDGQAALVTQVVEYPGGAKVIEGIAAAGDNQAALWTSIAPQVESLGRSLGLKKLRALGRMGWARACIPHGWRAEMTLIEKDLA